MDLLLLLQMHYGWTRTFWHQHCVLCPQVERMTHIWLIVFCPWQWPTATLTRSFPFRNIEAGVQLPSMKSHKKPLRKETAKVRQWLPRGLPNVCWHQLYSHPSTISDILTYSPRLANQDPCKQAAVVRRNEHKHTSLTFGVRCTVFIVMRSLLLSYGANISEEHVASTFRAEVV
jgi:hypothetical protein